MPFDTRMLPAVPGVVRPVPPKAAPNVPPAVIVPDDVIGPPLKVRPVEPPDTLTEVTVPVPPTPGAVSPRPIFVPSEITVVV